MFPFLGGGRCLPSQEGYAEKVADAKQDLGNASAPDSDVPPAPAEACITSKKGSNLYTLILLLT